MNSVSAPMALTASVSALSYARITAFQHSFSTNLAYRITQHAMTQTSMDDIALHRDSVTCIEPSGRMRG
jgi:hypothetical protein